MYVINHFEKQDYLFTVNTFFYNTEKAGSQDTSINKTLAVRSLCKQQENKNKTLVKIISTPFWSCLSRPLVFEPQLEAWLPPPIPPMIRGELRDGKRLALVCTS